MPLTRPSAFSLQLSTYGRTFTSRSFLVPSPIISNDGLGAVHRARKARKKRASEKKKTIRRGAGSARGRKEEGTRIWPLQLEERGKARGVANPCEEPLYFPKEMLRAPDVLFFSSLVRKIARARPRSLSACLFPRRSRVTATRAARFQHVSTTWEGSRSNLPYFFLFTSTRRRLLSLPSG